MPVTDLTDYLGMPQQAPEDPLFYQKQREAAYAQEAVDFNKRVAARGELNRLQRQAPVLQAQQAQIAYDKVAQDARDLRMKQEIEAQVERAANELAGGNLNPESDDFGAKYRDLATRNPLAFSDPRFSDVAGLYAAQNQNYQAARKQQMEAEARAAQEIINARNRAIAFGVPPEKIPSKPTMEQIAIEEGKVRAAGKGTRGGATSAEGARLKTILDVRKDRVARFENSDFFDDQDPKYIKAVNDLIKSEDDLITFNETGGVPVAPLPSVQTGIGGVSGRALGDSGIPVRPKEQAIVQPTQVPITPEGQIDIDKIPFGEIDKTIERVNEQAKAQEEVAKAWNSAQMDLEKKLEKLYPGNIGNTNYSKLARFAKAVLNKELMEDTGKDIVLDENGQPLRVLVGQAALEKLGLSPEGDAFTEPGKARKNFFGIGSQIVPNKQLLETWANNYLKRAPTTVQPTLPAISQENAAKKTNLLKKVGIGANG